MDARNIMREYVNKVFDRIDEAVNEQLKLDNDNPTDVMLTEREAVLDSSIVLMDIFCAKLVQALADKDFTGARQSIELILLARASAYVYLNTDDTAETGSVFAAKLIAFNCGFSYPEASVLDAQVLATFEEREREVIGVLWPVVCSGVFSKLDAKATSQQARDIVLKEADTLDYYTSSWFPNTTGATRAN